MLYHTQELAKEFGAPLPIYLKPKGYELKDGSVLNEQQLATLLPEGSVLVLRELLNQEGNPQELVMFGGSLHMSLLGITKKNMQSDTDIIVGSLQENIPLKENRMHTKVTISETEVDITHRESLIKEKLQGIEELLKSTTNEAMITKLIQLRGKLVSAELEDLSNLISLLPFEVISLSVKKEEGISLEGTINDPHDFISSMKRQRDLQNEGGHELGLAYNSLNTESLSYLYLQFLNESAGKVELNTMESLWALRPMGRILIATCDKSMEFVRTLEEISAGNEIVSDFELFHNVLQKVMSNELQLKIQLEGKDINGKDFLIEQLQSSFSRACASDLLTAVDFITTTFPLGDIVNEELGDIFNTWHDVIKPNTDFWLNFRSSANGNVDLNPYFKRDPASGEEKKQLEEAIMFHQHLIHNIQTYYKSINYIDSDLLVTSPGTVNGEPATYLPSTITANNMSEVIGLLCYTSGLTIEKDEDKIRQIIENWKPKDILTDTWLATNKEFDNAIEISAITFVLKTMENLNKKEGGTN